MHTGAVETKHHTAPNSPECNRTKIMRLYPDTRERSNKSAAPTATTCRASHAGQTPGARNATRPPAADPGGTRTIRHVSHRGYHALPHRSESSIDLQLIPHGQIPCKRYAVLTSLHGRLRTEKL